MNNPESKYSVEVFDPQGNLVADLTGFCQNRAISFKRNRSDSFNFNLDFDAMRKLASDEDISVWDILAVNQNEVRVTRLGRVITAGQIVYAYPRIDGETRTFEIKVLGWLDLMADRVTSASQVYSQVDAAQIAWDLVDQSQLQGVDYDFGFVQGSLQASMPRDRTYSLKNIKDAIIELSEVIDGFDFEFTWDKVFNVYYPKIGSKRPDIVFNYPGNIIGMGFSRDGTSVANKIIARGAGGGSTLIQIAEDAGSEKALKVRELPIDYNDISDAATLAEHAVGEVNARARFLDMPDLTLSGDIDPVFGTYGIGDEVRIQVSEELEVFSPINDYFRIDAMDLTIDDEDKETVRIRLMH